MFHGNAAVERNLSVNKNWLVENLEEDSLIAQRCVHSAINHYGGIESVPVTAGMIKAFRSASGKRNDALQQKRLKKSTNEHAQKLAAAE
ncbi:hypothetical protein JTE90_008638 [Oedothorax gibbosus]|uniref:Uncharacterized protein n=1 Tax=Oedothorax gibbosus TaxID=931172 RepID=A0AAV6U0J4_9ARAC|nr:hypothetical protein JTE90_008638 [Oedothorax gibbosus]